MTKIEFVDHSTVTLYKSNAYDVDCARAAWVSQNTQAHEKEAEEGRVEGLINFLLREKHLSPFENGSFTFIIDTPISVAREFMRHRSFAYSEVSGRYTELEPRFYTPNPYRPVLQQGKVGNYTFVPDSELSIDHVIPHIEANSRDSWNSYQALLEYGVAKEVARMVLPVNTMTTFWATVNPRNLMHFLDLRTDAQAMFEIREVAVKMEEIFKQQMPLTYKAWSKNQPNKEVDK